MARVTYAPRHSVWRLRSGALNTSFVIVEAIFGVISNSTALLADAGHNLSDVAGLLMAWGAAALSRRAPTTRYTYGLRSSSILAALFNAMFLLTAVGAIAWEAVGRFAHPEPVASKTVMIVAAVGIAINGLTAWLFASGRKDDINIRGAFLHMAADAAVSAGVVVAGALILFTDWSWVDPAMSVAICAVIVWSTWGLLKDSVRMSLDAVPAGSTRPAYDLPGAGAGHRHAATLHLAHEHDETALRTWSCRRNPGDAFALATR